LLNEEQKRIVDDFDHFTFEGIYPGMERLHYTGDIVYRVHDKFGSRFDYSYKLWQQKPVDALIIYQTVFKQEVEW
jgi:hypothetical protein